MQRAHNCLAAGLNKRIIVNGVIATVTAVLAPGAVTAAIQITGRRIAASAEGRSDPGGVSADRLPRTRSLAEKK